MRIFDLLGSRATASAEHVIAFAHQRMKVMANNLANIDTPGYRMRDLAVGDFEQTLARAIQRSKRTHPNLSILDLPTPAEIDRSSARGPDAAKLRGIVFHDDNDRSIEKLVVAMTKNANRQAQAVGLLRKQIQLLRAIISESAS